MELRAAEEGDEERTGLQLRCPRDRALDVVACTRRDGGIGVRDAAEVAVLAEHEARHLEPRSRLLPNEPAQPVRREVRAADDELDAVEREFPREVEDAAARAGVEHGIHHADLHDA